MTRTVTAATDVLGAAPAVNRRVGPSDARIFRKAGIPTVVFGPTPYNMGAADEYVIVDELVDVMRVHALSAFDFLRACRVAHRPLRLFPFERIQRFGLEFTRPRNGSLGRALSAASRREWEDFHDQRL